MKTILITGGSGLVGSRFIELSSSKYKILSPNQEELDITDRNSIEKYFNEHPEIETVINFAAFTNVDVAEKERNNENGLCWRLNVMGAKNIAEVCQKNNRFLIHISTDFIFKGDNDNPGPYSEDAKIPENMEGIGWYGWTKNRAEDAVQKVGGKVAIVRYGYPFRADNYEVKVDWARNLIKLYNEQKLYPLFADQVQSVVLIDELVQPMGKIIDNEINGIFHIASSETNTPYEIGTYLLGKYTGKTVEIQKGSMEEFLKAPGKTPRPRLGGLKTEKTQEILGMKFKTWKEMVDEFIDQLSTS
jgi:dTDP-4-dehydrorhamnose reductase